MKSIRTKKFIAILFAVTLAFTLAVPANGIQTVAANQNRMLIPGGMAFGVKLFTEGAIVLGTTGVETAAGLTCPAKDCGIKSGDIITRAGGVAFDSAAELVSFIEGSGGKDVVLTLCRDGKERITTVSPARDIETGKFKIGVLVRDSTAGIGTVTYIDPKTNSFGGLGHGIYDSETEILMPLARGAVVDVEITGVVKSYPNAPGELKGEFQRIAKGELDANTPQGVFGELYPTQRELPDAIPVGTSMELTEGDAYILTTLSGYDTREYDIEIEEIYDNSGSTKNFLVKITDEALLNTAGGIVQGMSGSPIIQNGKLVGAVTHVLVNDPTRGYGIYIENMLNTACDVGVEYTAMQFAA